MNIKESKKDTIIDIEVTLFERKKTEKVIVFNTTDARKHAIEKFKLNENQKLILLKKPAHDLMNHTINLSGKWTFRVESEKPVDILKNNVKINKTKIEAKPPVKEQKKEASLPNGLKKITKTKRKRAPRKKKTEE